MKRKTARLAAHAQHLLERVFLLPDWMQAIVLEDINVAIENRIAIMTMIEQKFGKRAR